MPPSFSCPHQTKLRLIPSSSLSPIGLREKTVCHQPNHLLLFQNQNQNHPTNTKIRMTTRSITAIREFKDMEPQQNNNNPKLRIGIVGFGNFGQFLAKTLVSQGHSVLAYNRRDTNIVATKLGIPFFCDLNHLCKHQPDVIILSTSINSTQSVLRAFPFQSLNPSTLFVDVLSVKEKPKQWLLDLLPPEFDILCTHPMFGPESGKNGWKDLPFVYEKVRIKDESRCDQLLNVFIQEGCRMVPLSCAKHDEWAAGSQFLTHLVGRIMGEMSLVFTPINTKGYQSLLDLVENTGRDSFDLFFGLFIHNKNAMDQLEIFDKAYRSILKKLLEQLHRLGPEQPFGREGVAFAERLQNLADGGCSSLSDDLAKAKCDLLEANRRVEDLEKECQRLRGASTIAS